MKVFFFMMRYAVMAMSATVRKTDVTTITMIMARSRLPEHLDKGWEDVVSLFSVIVMEYSFYW